MSNLKRQRLHAHECARRRTQLERPKPQSCTSLRLRLTGTEAAHSSSWARFPSGSLSLRLVSSQCQWHVARHFKVPSQVQWKAVSGTACHCHSLASCLHCGNLKLCTKPEFKPENFVTVTLTASASLSGGHGLRLRLGVRLGVGFWPSTTNLNTTSSIMIPDPGPRPQTRILAELSYTST